MISSKATIDIYIAKIQEKAIETLVPDETRGDFINALNHIRSAY